MNDLKELEQYYNNFFALFKTPGWQQLMETLTADAKNINNVQSLKDAVELHHAQGQLKILAWLLNFEELCEKTFEDATAGAEAEA